MNLAVFHSEFQIKQLLNRMPDNCLKIALNLNIQKQLNDAKLLNSYVDAKVLHETDRDAWFFLDTIRKAKVKNKTLDQIFTYRNIPLLESLQWEFYYYYFRRMLAYIKALSNLIKKERPKEVLVVDDGDLFCKVLEVVCNKEKVKLVKIIPSKLKQMQEELLKLKNVQTFDLYVSKPRLTRAAYTLVFYYRKLFGSRPGKRKAKKVLFFPNVDNQVEAFETVYSALKKMPGVVPKIISVDDPLGRVRKKLRARKLMYHNFEDYSPWNLKSLAEKNLRQIRQDWTQIGRLKVTYDGYEVGELIMEIISYLLFKRQRFNDVVEYIETIDNIIRIEEPSLLVNIAEYVPLGRALVATARNYNIKTANMPHAMLWYQIENSQVHSDYILVPGELSKKFLLEAGNKPNKLIVTGFPKLDLLYERKFGAAKVYEKLKLKKKQRFFTLATNPVPDEENTLLITAVIEAMKELPDIKLVIKLHPLETGGLQKKLVREMRYKNAIIIRDIDINELIHASELLMVYYSTVAVDAAIMGKPVLTINLTGKPDRLPYAKMGIAYGVYKKEELPDAINKVLKDEAVKQKIEKARETFIKNYYFRLDGRSGERAAKAIKEIIQ